MQACTECRQATQARNMGRKCRKSAWTANAGKNTVMVCRAMASPHEKDNMGVASIMGSVVYIVGRGRSHHGGGRTWMLHPLCLSWTSLARDSLLAVLTPSGWGLQA